MTDRERDIRDLAHQIWEEAGRPTGDDARHWSEAERRYAARQVGKPKPGKGDAESKSGKTSKLSEPAPAKGAKAAEPKTAAPKSAGAAKPKSKPARSSAKAEPAKPKGRAKPKG